MPKVTVRIDTGLCISAANCVGIAPELFQIGDEPFVELLDEAGERVGPERSFDATQAEVELIEEAAESCPTRAIELIQERS